MTTPKTIRVKRNQASDSTNVGEFASGHSSSEGPWTAITVPGHFDADELDITITEVKSLKQEGAGAHEWTKHEREGWTVCSRCGMVRNYDRETPCRGTTPPVAPRENAQIEVADLARKASEVPGLSAELDRVRWERDRAVSLLHMLDRGDARHPDVASFLDGLCRTEGALSDRETESEKHGVKR